MKVKELKKRLRNIPDNFDVILSKDDEGSVFGPLYLLGKNHYIPKTIWRGNIDVSRSPMNCVVLWPAGDD